MAQLADALEFLRLDLLLRLLLASLLGGIIGLEREFNGKPAGFRTNLLICVGAALLTEMSVYLPARVGVTAASYDPTRIAAQIVSGIGFLGAGTILQARGSVTGLTTAATLWVVSAIGIAVGAGAYVEAMGTTALVVMALIVLGRLERIIVRRRPVERRLALTLDPDPSMLERIRSIIVEAGLAIETIDLTKEETSMAIVVIASGRSNAWIEAKQHLLDLPGVRRIGGL